MTGKKLIILITLFLMEFLPAISFPGEVNLPKTGQETCYDKIDNVIDCSGTGQDGDIQAGVEWPTPRFKDNGDGTVTDKLTGLIWLENANCAGLKTWNDALTYCNTLASGSCGLTDGSVAGDWGLPNIIELESLVNAEEGDSAAWLNTQGFSNVQSHYYWSSTILMDYSSKIFGVDIGNGYNLAYGWDRWKTFSVWPVRGGLSAPAQTWQTGQIGSITTGDDGDLQRGVSWPVPRFKDNSDGTVTDHLTGLIWLKKTDCARLMTWYEASTYCNTLASGSCGLTDGSVAGDWRLPNRKELLSLIDYSRSRTTLPTDNKFDPVLSSSFWSATTNTYNYFANAWVVSTENGKVYSASKAVDVRVWPVRGGQVGSLDSLTILDPNGGESLFKGQDYTITWNSTNISGNIQIDLFKGGTKPENMLMQLAATTENDGEYPFNPPDSIIDGDNYLIKISAESGTVWDFSDFFFTINSETQGKAMPWMPLLILDD